MGLVSLALRKAKKFDRMLTAHSLALRGGLYYRASNWYAFCIMSFYYRPEIEANFRFKVLRMALEDMLLLSEIPAF